MALASKFVYKPRTKEQVDQRLSRTNSGFEGFLSDDCKLYRPTVGENSIRFLPPTWDNADHWGYEISVHYNVGPTRASALCLSRMYKKKCPICEAQVAATAADDKELASELRAQTAILAWVINIRDPDLGPLIYNMSFTRDQAINQLTRDAETGEIYQIDNPEEGFNVSFQRIGTTIKDTKYSGYQLSRRPSAIKEAWMQYAIDHPIPDMLVQRTYEQVKLLFEGADVPEEIATPTKSAAVDPPFEAETKAEPELPKPRFVSRAKPALVPTEPEETLTPPEPATAVKEEVPPPKTTAPTMSAAEALRAKLAARKAVQK